MEYILSQKYEWMLCLTALYCDENEKCTYINFDEILDAMNHFKFGPKARDPRFEGIVR